jgi:uncharacterized protein (TIGR03067 family)
MKRLILLTLVCLSLSCASTKKNSKDQFMLNGIWTPVKQEIGGKELPSVAFQTQRLIIADSLYTFTAESADKGILQYNNGKMDIYGKEGVNSGKHFTAIYKIENELLTICYNLKGDGYPAGFETKSQPALFLSVFKKNKL